MYNVSETLVIKITINLTKKKFYRLCTFGLKLSFSRSQYYWTTFTLPPMFNNENQDGLLRHVERLRSFRTMVVLHLQVKNLDCVQYCMRSVHYFCDYLHILTCVREEPCKNIGRDIGLHLRGCASSSGLPEKKFLGIFTATQQILPKVLHFILH
jgi:hypothetical protein